MNDRLRALREQRQGSFPSTREIILSYVGVLIVLAIVGVGVVTALIFIVKWAFGL